MPPTGASVAFLLNAALRSMAGGNARAARQRLGLCKQELVAQAEGQGYTPELCCQLGDVCGSQVGVGFGAGFSPSPLVCYPAWGSVIPTLLAGWSLCAITSQ